MRNHGANRCLVAATVSALMALSLGAAAQEEQQTEEQEPQQQPQSQAAPKRLFVSDKLVLNVYAQADQGSARVATIETGDAVEEVERAENFVRVRLDDGREGWVGVNYLTSTAPAAARVRDMEREQKTAVQAAEKKSADEIARLKKETAALQAQVKDLKANVAPAPAVDSATSAPAEETPQDGSSQEPAAAVPPDPGGASWMWPFVAVLGTGLGFAAGYQTLAKRIRKKFGGLKIY